MPLENISKKRFKINDWEFSAIMNDKALLSLSFGPGAVSHDEGHSSVFDLLKEELKAYFDGKLRSFSVPIALQGTDFQLKVWEQLLRIPFGVTLTYAQMAQKLNNPLVIRAAANANGKNPISIIVPCHRVIGTDGKLVGFAGGLDKKKKLLDHENKHFHGVLQLFDSQ